MAKKKYPKKVPFTVHVNCAKTVTTSVLTSELLRLFCIAEKYRVAVKSANSFLALIELFSE